MQSAGGVPIPTPTLPGTARKENERYRKGENKRKRERKREGKEWEDKLIQRDQNGREGRGGKKTGRRNHVGTILFVFVQKGKHKQVLIPKVGIKLCPCFTVMAKYVKLRLMSEIFMCVNASKRDALSSFILHTVRTTPAI